MRKCALKFLERVSFNEIYLCETNKYKKNKEQIDKNNKLIGLLRGINIKNHANP